MRQAEEETKQKKNYIKLDKIEARRGGTHKEAFTVKCAFMYNVYGIVKVEKCNNNKSLKLYILVTSFLLFCLSMQRLGNPKMSLVYHSALDINNNIHDTIPLDISRNKVLISQHCHT